MNPGDIEKQLWETYRDWSGFLVNPRFCRRDRLVAWSRYDVGIIREPVTYEKVRHLVETKQYSFQSAEDGSVFQLLYEFDHESRLLLARLGFYKVAALADESELKGGPLPERTGLVPWIRFDFNPSYSAGVLHAASHLHIWGFPDARLPVDGVPGPRQFIELVAAMCYPSYYRAHRLTDAGQFTDSSMISTINVNCIGASGTGSAVSLVHLRVPDHVAL